MRFELKVLIILGIFVFIFNHPDISFNDITNAFSNSRFTIEDIFMGFFDDPLNYVKDGRFGGIFIFVGLFIFGIVRRKF